jgi:dATP pyrophosphohydrolase
VYKIPISILVAIYNEKNQILLLQRYDNNKFWQSVTGSLNTLNEELHIAAEREVFEETSIQILSHTNINIDKFNAQTLDFNTLCNLNYTITYNIYPEFRHKYPPFTISNQEHWFALKINSKYNNNIKLSDYEHTSFKWVELGDSKKECFSPSNAIAIQKIFQN